MTAETFYEEAMNHHASGDTAGAIYKLEQALMLKADFAEAWNGRGAMLAKIGNSFDAVVNYDRAVSINPLPQYMNNRGAAYFDLCMFEKALENYNAAVTIKPDLAPSWSNIGNVYMQMKEIDKAESAYRSAVHADFSYVEGHMGLSFALLEQGKFSEGWDEYEWRWKSPQAPVRGLPIKDWDGKPGRGGLLLYGEQGLGDALQFMRFAKEAKKAWGGNVYLEVRPQLSRLARFVPGVDGIIVYGEEIPSEVNAVLPMMSVPRVLGHSYGETPYLFAQPHRTKIWEKAVRQLPAGMKIGICWAGAARPLQPYANAIDRRRSTTLAEFGVLAIAGVSFVSLQLGNASAQAKTPPRGMVIMDCAEDIGDFYDTAALVQNLDLVITVDTSVVHLAAGMGKPTWLLSRFDSCWRWMGNRPDSPWYPSLRHFRQQKPGDWPGLLQTVRGELEKLVKQSKAA